MHDKRNKDKGRRELPSSGEKRSGRKGDLSAWPVKVIRDFSFRNSRRGNGLFSGASTGFFALSGVAFRQLGAGQEAGRHGPEERISRTGRRECLYPGFGFSRGFSDRNKPEGRPLGRRGSNTACPGKAK